MTPLTICLIICALTMISYIIGKIPMGLTAMLSMVAFVLTDCLKPATTAGYFGNANGIMMLSMFMVAAGFNRTQFVKKCATSVNKIAKGSLTKVMLGYIVVAAVLAQFIQSSVIVYGIMAPMLIASCEELNIKPSKVLFPLAMVCIATISTLPLGSGATVFAEMNGYLEANDYTVFAVGLTDAMKARLPMLIIMVVYCIFFATKFAPSEPPVEVGTIQARKEDKAPLKPFQERAGYIIFILTTLALLFQRQLGVEVWVICISGALAMILFGVLTEKEAIGAINWPMAFLFVGALAMGGALTETGAGEAVGQILANVANKIDDEPDRHDHLHPYRHSGLQGHERQPRGHHPAGPGRLPQLLRHAHGHPRHPHVHGQRRLQHPVASEAVHHPRHSAVRCGRGLDHDRFPHVLSLSLSHSRRRTKPCWKSSNSPRICLPWSLTAVICGSV